MMDYKNSDNNSDRPFVSVVIPAYNRESTIGRTIDSVLKQTYTDYEIIVVDDGSSDSTVNVLKNYPSLKIVEQKNSGANVARNVGINKARGELIAFLDSDDEWIPDKLEKMVKFILENNLQAAYSPYFLVDGNEKTIVKSDYWNEKKYGENIYEYLKRENSVGTPTLVITKKLMMEIGCFDEKMPRMQDYELAIRIVQKTKLGYYPEPLLIAYRTPNSISKNNYSYKMAVERIIEKHANFIDLTYWVREYISFCFEDELDYEKDLLRLQSVLSNNNREAGVLLRDYVRKSIFWDITKFEYVSRLAKLKTQEFCIYGAGSIAKDVYRDAMKKNKRPKVFVVSKKAKDQQIDGIPVIDLEEYIKKYRNLDIIIGVVQQEELINNLIENNVKNYFKYPFV